MNGILQGTIGILPPGALGVGFFYHLTRKLAQIDGSVFFVERDGSSSAAMLRSIGELLIGDETGLHRQPLAPILKPELSRCQAAACLPEVLLICPNPDQLLPLLTPCVSLLERASETGTLDPAALPLPLLVLCSNGIYFQRIRQVFLEKLEESTLLGRLPDLWPDLMPSIVGRLLRGVSLQTALRDGDGSGAVYRPGPSGPTRLAGGDLASRCRAHELLAGRGGLFEIAETASPTRTEFDKAMVNLAANLLGQLAAIDEDGRFSPLALREILSRIGESAVRDLVRRVVEIGRAVRAYGPKEDLTGIGDTVFKNLQRHGEHMPSSLQWLSLRLKRGEAITDLSPTELWLLDPLMYYARSAGLNEALNYFESLRSRLREKLARASERAARST